MFFVTGEDIKKKAIEAYVIDVRMAKYQTIRVQLQHLEVKMRGHPHDRENQSRSRILLR